jgi:hypothetical protein
MLNTIHMDTMSPNIYYGYYIILDTTSGDDFTTCHIILSSIIILLDFPYQTLGQPEDHKSG